MSETESIVFLFDVDNTLLDNDHVVRDLASHLDQHFGAQRRERYFAIFEELRGQLGYADYLGALQRYRVEHPTDSGLLEMSSFLLDYPFNQRLFPGALESIKHCRQWGQTVILSDGDVVFQPRKVRRSGIFDAVEGQVLIYIHKEQMLADVEARYPARHYVLIDDKVRILTAVKQHWGERLTTIFPVQGRYALDEKTIRLFPTPDLTIRQIGQLYELDLAGILNAARSG